MGGVGSTHAVE